MELRNFDQLVLRAIKELGNNAYGLTIRRKVQNLTTKYCTILEIYLALERLEAEDKVVSSIGTEFISKRGNRPRTYWNIKEK